MKEKTDIWLYIIVGLMSAALLLAIATAIYGIMVPSYEYERGYMDGFRDGENMQCNYGTVKMKGINESKE